MMKHISNISIFILIFLQINLQAQNLYDPDHINNIDITFDTAEWDSILSKYHSAGNNARMRALFEINGDTVENAGIRYKGYSSYKRSNLKKPLNIELNYLSAQDYQGYQTLKLSNCYRDPSLLREVLAYEIARKYMPASLANYAKVYINDEYLGLYTNVQSVDRNFLENHFGNDDGVFVKGAPAVGIGGSYLIGKADIKYRGEDSSAYLDSYELKSDEGWPEIIGLFKALGDPNSDIESLLNIDRTLWFLAYHNLLVSLDSPINAPRNFYLYKNLNGLFELIIWDLNMTFGTYQTFAGTYGIAKFDELVSLDPFHNINNDDYPLMKRILNVPLYRRMYIAHMKTILEENFSNGWYKTRAEELQELIAPSVVIDDNKFYTIEEFWENLETTIGGGSVYLPGIVDLMQSRTAFLKENSDLRIEQPEIEEVSFSPQAVRPHTDLTITAKINMADDVFLMYRNNRNEIFNKIQMYDDGDNEDGDYGDGVYGATINAGTGELQYYIYAEHQFAGKFSPERAAHEYHSISIAGDLVINEFLASNDTTYADESGEFDDWIELYNNTGSDISLLGFYLSDKSDNLKKWELPDTIISANDYLIVWADEDSSQGPLHANFKLSAGGEDIFLVDSDSLVVDHVNYIAQETDISYGRFPNGLGNFIPMLPTVLSGNTNSLSNTGNGNDIPEGYILSQNYPNPFNPVTTIEYSLPIVKRNSVSLNGQKEFGESLYNVSIKVFDILGRQVDILVNESQPPGNYAVQFNASHLASGVYFYLFQTNDFFQTKKMLLLK